MIKFYCRKRHQDGTPIIRDADIVRFAEAQLRDYRPELLEEPGKIDPIHFIEKYLGANIDFQDIYYEEGASQIAGATVFNDEEVRVFDRENMCTKNIAVKAGTIIIDNSTIQDRNEGFARFTELHEAGHLCMHPAVYCTIPGQMSMFAARSLVMCKRETMEMRRRRLVTQEDFREHQANVYAAALEMPARTFSKLTLSLIRDYDIGMDGNQVLVIPRDFNYDFEVGLARIISDLAETFGASSQAVRIQLQARGFLMTQKEYIQAYNQYRFRNGYDG